MSETVPFRRLLRHPVATATSVEASALMVAALVFVASGAVGLAVFWGAPAEIAGPDSVGQFTALASVVVAVGVYVFARVLARRQATEPEGSRIRWFDVVALALAHGIIALLGWLALADLFERSFVGAELYPLAAAALTASALAVTAYAVFLSALAVGALHLSLILVVFLVCGVFASMLTASDPLWWQLNLSTLGISDDLSARAFNITLVIAGVIVTTIAHVAVEGLPAERAGEVRSRRVIRVALSLIGVLLACVGLFPVDEFLTAHNVSASGMLVVFVVLVVDIRRLVPGLPQPFLVLGYVFLGVIAVIAVFFLTGYYTLTATELVAFLLVFAWLIVFLRITGASEQGRAGDVQER